MKFVDLFAGLGGFHVGLKNLGHECVFACEIDAGLRQLYEKNHGIYPVGDIREVNPSDIPKHDILCAGFPCQPFSLAGKKKGAKCPESGKLIDYVIEIAKFHKPAYVLLENVPNILTIEDGAFWDYLQKSFKKINYRVQYKVISPVDLGIPQNRKRVFVVATRAIEHSPIYTWPAISPKKEILFDILEPQSIDRKLEDPKVALLQLWQELLNTLNLQSLPSVSIVAPEFGATYPVNFQQISLKNMKRYKGAYGVSLASCKSWEDLMANLPSYTITNKKQPTWMLRSIQFTRELFNENSKKCMLWSEKLEKKHNSWQILEWRGKRTELNIYKHLVQFRASGIRVLKPETAPSLISMTPTQVPVIPLAKRYLSAYEAAKLQNLHTLKYLPSGTTKAFKALGNAVIFIEYLFL